MYETLLAEQQAYAGRLAESEPLMRRAALGYFALASPDGKTGHAVLSRLNGLLARLAHEDNAAGDHAKALRRRREIVAMMQRMHGADDWKTSEARYNADWLERLVQASGAEAEAMSEFAKRTGELTLLAGEGKLDEANRIQVELLPLARRVFERPHPLHAELLSSTAVRMFDRGEFGRALSMFHESIAIYESLEVAPEPRIAHVRMRLGTLLSMLGRYDEALPLLQGACQTMEESVGAYSTPLAEAEFELGRHYVRVGDSRTAYPHLAKAFQLFIASGSSASPLALQACERLADVFRQTGNLQKAEELVAYQKNLVYEVYGDSSSQAVSVLTAEARHLFMRRRYEEALARYSGAAKLAETHYGGASRSYLSVLRGQAEVRLAQGDTAAVTDCLEQILERQIAERESLFGAYDEGQQLKRAEQDLGCLDSLVLLALDGSFDATRAYQLAVAFKGAVTARQRGLRVAMRNPNAKRVLEEIEQIESLERLMKSGAKVAGENNPSRLGVERRRLEAELASLNRSYGLAIGRTRVADIQRLLPADTVLVDYYEYLKPKTFLGSLFGGRPRFGLVAFVVPPKGEVRLVDLGDLEEVTRSLASWRATMQAEPVYEIAQPEARAGEVVDEWGVDVRRRVWDPLAPLVGDAQTVVISPSDLLTSCPMPALPTGDGAFLIERHALVSIATPRSLPELFAERAGAADASLLLVGDIDYGPPSGGIGFVKLDNARQELTSVSRAFQHGRPKARVTEMVGRQAREGLVSKAVGGATTIHFCTHGFFMPRGGPGEEGEGAASEPFVAGVVLSGGNRWLESAERSGRDGVLEASEIAELDLHKADLVTLSACQTALGEFASGEGMLGAQRALYVAGARSSLTALWAVSDDATKELMSRFYDRLWREKQPKAQALRGAMVSMLRDYSWREASEREGPPAESRRTPPAFWAGFVLHGDWR